MDGLPVTVVDVVVPRGVALPITAEAGGRAGG
jgi:hypothetical protein